MNDTRTKQVPEIEALLAERRKYEQWLAQLDARKDSTPAHVFVKVHGDYTARLAEAQAKLSAESAAVSAMASQMEASLAKQERQISDRNDERAEAELRASVGEFGAKEWDKLRAKLDSAIADLSTERDGIQAELDTLRALLTETVPVEAAEPVAPAAASKPQPVAPAAAEVKDEPKGDVDDIAFLRSVLGRNTPYSSTPAPAPAAVPAPAQSEPPTAGRVSGRVSAPVEKRPSIPTAGPIADTETKPAPVRASVPVAAPALPPEPIVELPALEVLPAYEPAMPEAPRASTTGRGSGSIARPSTGSSAVQPRLSVPELFATPEVPEDPSGPRGSNDHKASRPSGTFGQATPRTSEAVKSLKCQECGTLNYPTEWYCERCGGELAAF